MLLPMGRSRWLVFLRVGSRSGRATPVNRLARLWLTSLQLSGCAVAFSRLLGLQVVLRLLTVRSWTCRPCCVLRRRCAGGALLLASSLVCRVLLVSMRITGGVLVLMRGGLTVLQSATSAPARIACATALCVWTLSRMRSFYALRRKCRVRQLARSGSRRGWSGRRVARCLSLLICFARRCVTAGARLGRVRSLFA